MDVRNFPASFGLYRRRPNFRAAPGTDTGHRARGPRQGDQKSNCLRAENCLAAGGKGIGVSKLSREQIETLKDRYRIPQAWRDLGLRGEPPKAGKSCCSPLRDDRHPSFVIIDDGRAAIDFGTGERFDTPGFIARALNLSPGDGFKRFLEMASGGVNGDCAVVEQNSPREKGVERRAKNWIYPSSENRLTPSSKLLRVIAGFRKSHCKYPDGWVASNAGWFADSIRGL